MDQLALNEGRACPRLRKCLQGAQAAPGCLGHGGRRRVLHGAFALFTYVRPFLETVTNVDVSTLSLILLGIGIAWIVGNSLIGWFLKNGLYGTLILLPVLLAIIVVALIGFGDRVTATAALLGVWGLIATAAPVGWWTWLAKSLPQDAEAGGGLMVAVVQLAITLGATAGGLLFDSAGYQSVFSVSALLLLIGALLAFLTSRAGRDQSA